MEEIFKDLLGDKWGGMLARYLPIVLLVLIAWFAIKFIMKFVKKGIANSKLPKNAHSIACSFIKILLYF